MNIKKILSATLALALVLGIFGVSAASAETTTSTAQQQVESLLKQIKDLQEQMQQLRTQQKDIVQDILTTLNAGSVGDAVKILQAVLAADPDIYPEGRITGFFGALTRRAVMNFQKQNGLPQVGNVGPRTLEKLKEKLKDNPLDLEDSDSNEGKRPCAIVPPGHLIAAGWLRKHDGVRPIVPPCQKLPPGILNHMGSSTPTSTPHEDVTAPVISRIRTDEATSSVVVTWLTNEPATSQILYGTSTSMGSSTTLDTSLVKSHSQTITGLENDTTYYFEVQSKDAAGNVQTSAQHSFLTEED